MDWGKKMKRHLAALTAVALAGSLLVAAPGAGAAGNGRGNGPKPKPSPSPTPTPTNPPQQTTDCSGYVERRQFVESQGWWTQTPGQTGTDFGHIHVGACIPERETIRGVVPLDVRVILHDNPGTLRYLGIVVKGAGYEATVAKPTIPNFTCPSGTCSGWLHYDLDTSLFQRSGRQEIRFRTLLDTPDGNSMHAGLNFQVIVDNGKAFDDYEREPHLRGKGWYTTSGYCEATMKSVPIPDAPLSGTWSPTVAMIEHSTGTVNDLVTAHSVRLDPDLHNGVEGTILRSGAGTFEGPVAIDTTRLTNGPHRLMLKADCENAAGSTNAGLLVIPFVVQN
jgi:hypothetical protein